jgi:hypothetical protein
MQTSLRVFACASLLVTACGTDPVAFVGPDAAVDVATVATDATVDATVDATPDAPDAAPDRAPVEAAVDAGPPDVPIAPGMTVDYVFSRFTIDGDAVRTAPNPAIHTQGVAGFNLDGRFTGAVAAMPADCAHGDFFSTLDPDQNMGACTVGSARGGSGCVGGVDNQLPAVADLVMGFGNNLRTSIDTLVDTGRTVVIVRVAGLDAPPSPELNDTSVTVLVYPVARPMFARCAMSGTPGLAYAIDDASLTRAGDLASARYRFPAAVVRGRLVTQPSRSPGADFAINVPLTGGVPATFELSRTQIRADLAADRATQGNLGGYTPLRAVAAAVSTALPAGIPESTVTALLQSLVDVQVPAGDPEGCYAPNGAIALGMGFTAVRAVVAERTVAGAPAGMCGSE